ncbi:MAG: HlyC/CorC family transporter [Candidatus Riflebacteria bacterium]|nr:HlyC/CorC family transporter [Candidatus Riflebacteria bacterium]
MEPSLNALLECLALILAVWGLALFTGLEGALVALGRLHGAAEDPSGKDELFAHPQRLLAFLVTGATLCVSTALVAAAALWLELLGPAPARLALVTVFVTLPVVYVLGELLPRALFRGRAQSVFARLAGLLRLLYRPFSAVADGMVRVGLVGIDPERGGAWRPRLLRATREELQRLLAAETRERPESAAGHRILSQIFDARELTVDRVMHDRSRLVSAPVDASRDELIATVVQSGFSRIPVWRENPWTIAGIVHATDLLQDSDSTRTSSGTGRPGQSDSPDRPEAVRQGVLREPLRVSPETTVLAMLRRFQASRSHMAIVESPPGTAVGLLTIEDLLERFIGDIRDEHDPKQSGTRQLFWDTFLVDAGLDIASVNRRVGVEIPAGEYDTLAGFLLDRLRKIPVVGDQVSVGSVLFFVTKADGKRAEQVVVKRVGGSRAR